jgi:uncharacterized protein
MNSRHYSWRRVIMLVVVFCVTSCSPTYYQSNYDFNREFESGNLDKALSQLQSNTAEANGRKEFLYYLNNGLVLSMMGRYSESNEYFEKAFLFGEDYRKNYLYEAASYLTNPMVTPYRGEDHEHLMLLYYKAINFLKMGKPQEALVECKRLNIRLQQLSDRYGPETRYKRDAFIHTLMGIIYETDKDYNNAFIAYRNAYTIYQEDYKPLFQMEVPQQLKKDLVRTARISGLTEEYEQYLNEFAMKDTEITEPQHGELIFFWHNGLAPIKSEWAVTFFVNRNDNWITFYNSQLGFSFPFRVDQYNDRERSGLSSLEVVRVAFPRYVERPVHYQEASLIIQDQTITLQQLEDLNKIAFYSLQQRMHLEFAKALIRVALKKAAEHQLKKEDRLLGSVLGAINAVTEKADTRNWQTLPYSIHYARIPLAPGKNNVALKLRNGHEEVTHTFTYEGKKGQILFHTFTSLESGYPSYGY